MFVRCVISIGVFSDFRHPSLERLVDLWTGKWHDRQLGNINPLYTIIIPPLAKNTHLGPVTPSSCNNSKCYAFQLMLSDAVK